MTSRGVDPIAPSARTSSSTVAPRLRTRLRLAAQLQTLRLIQRHGQHASVAEADHLRADAAAAGGKDLAEIADGHRRAGGFNQQTNRRRDLATPRQGIDLWQVFKVGRERYGVIRLDRHL